MRFFERLAHVQTSISIGRERQMRYLSQAIQLEEAVNPHIIRATMNMISLFVLAFIIWSSMTEIKEVARTPGEVVPHGYQQTVQHLEGGIVAAIHIHEGEEVKAGQVLLQLDQASLKTDLDRAQGQQAALLMQQERLQAFVDDRLPDFSKINGVDSNMIKEQMAIFDSMKDSRDKESKVIAEQIIQRQQSISTLESDLATTVANLKIAENMYAKRQELNKKGYSSDMNLLESETKVNEIRGGLNRLNTQILMAKTEMTEFEGRLSSLNARQRDDSFSKLDLVNTDIAQNKEIIQKLQERLDRMAIRAPIDGLVKGLAINTVGAVIQPGQTVMEIVPMTNDLEVQVKISPRDIGHLRIGQSVQIKFSTYDFSRYGSVKGHLDQISATTFTGENGERYYRGRVSLEKKYVGHDVRNTVMPGMTVMADIITGQKTILQYLLKPIHLSLKNAFTER